MADMAALNLFRRWKEQLEAESQLTRYLDADFWADHLPGLHRQLQNIAIGEPGEEFYHLLGLTDTILGPTDPSEHEYKLLDFFGDIASPEGEDSPAGEDLMSLLVE